MEAMTIASSETNVDKVSIRTWTAHSTMWKIYRLHVAAMVGYFQDVRLLLDYGAYIDAPAYLVGVISCRYSW